MSNRLNFSKNCKTPELPRVMDSLDSDLIEMSDLQCAGNEDNASDMIDYLMDENIPHITNSDRSQEDFYYSDVQNKTSSSFTAAQPVQMTKSSTDAAGATQVNKVNKYVEELLTTVGKRPPERDPADGFTNLTKITTVVSCFAILLLANLRIGITDDKYEVEITDYFHMFKDEYVVPGLSLQLVTKDFISTVISTIMLFTSFVVSSPMDAYLRIPWLGLTFKALVFVQIPTVAWLFFLLSEYANWKGALLAVLTSFLILEEFLYWFEMTNMTLTSWKRHDLNRTREYILKNLRNDEDIPSELTVLNAFYSVVKETASSMYKYCRTKFLRTRTVAGAKGPSTVSMYE